MKILHVANFSENKFGAALYSTDRKISNGLTRNGHYVYDFSYRDVARNLTIFRSSIIGRRAMVEAFLTAVDMVGPQLLLLGHSELLRPEDLVAARRRNPSMKVAMWWVDDPFPSDRIALLKERMGVVDALFTTVGVVPLMRALGERSGTKIAFFPNIIDRSIEIGRAFEQDHALHDLVFIGQATPERHHLLQALEKMSPAVDIGVYGGSKSTKIYGRNYVDILSRSRMGLNFSRYNDVALYSSDRLAHLVGNGLLTFTPRVPGLERLFTEQEVVYFDGWGDLATKVAKYQDNWELGRNHAKRGYLKGHSSYNECRVTRFIMDTIFDEPYSERYEWQDQMVC